MVKQKPAGGARAKHGYPGPKPKLKGRGLNLKVLKGGGSKAEGLKCLRGRCLQARSFLGRAGRERKAARATTFNRLPCDIAHHTFAPADVKVSARPEAEVVKQKPAGGARAKHGYPGPKPKLKGRGLNLKVLKGGGSKAEGLKCLRGRCLQARSFHPQFPWHLPHSCRRCRIRARENLLSSLIRSRAQRGKRCSKSWAATSWR